MRLDVRLRRGYSVAVHITPDELEVFELPTRRTRDTLLARCHGGMEYETDPVTIGFDGQVGIPMVWWTRGV